MFESASKAFCVAMNGLRRRDTRDTFCFQGRKGPIVEK